MEGYVLIPQGGPGVGGALPPFSPRNGSAHEEVCGQGPGSPPSLVVCLWRCPLGCGEGEVATRTVVLLLLSPWQAL